MESNDGIVLVVRSGQKCTDTNLFKLLLEPFYFLLNLLRGVFLTFLGAQFNKLSHILIVCAQFLNFLHKPLQILQLLHGLLGFLRIIPESGFLNLSLQFLNLLIL